MVGSWLARHLSGMMRKAFFLVFLALSPEAARSLEADGCLNAEQARGEISAHKLVDMHQAARAARARVRGEVVSANLCRVDRRLVYVVAILSPGGKVARVTVDAVTSVVSDQR
jgi:uncharacterized membrane protein YkoI